MRPKKTLLLLLAAVLIAASLTAQRINPCQFTRIDPTCGPIYTGVAPVLYFRIVSSAGPTFLSLMNYLIPGVALATGVAVGGESFEWRVLGALALILAGLFTSQTEATQA